MTEITREPLTPVALPDGVAALLTDAQAARWAIERSFYQPHVLVARDGEEIVGAALTAGRPATRYVKIVDLVAADSSVRQQLVDAVVEAALAEGHVLVKWELWDGAVLDESLGFVEARKPFDDRDVPDAPRGAVRWLVDWPHAEQRYYRQTTEVTCGAVSLLLAAPMLGEGGFAAEDAEPNHVTELELWRQATNFPACEPVGLGVAARKAYPGLAVDVHLDTDQPVLLEEFPEDFMTGFRRDLQQQSRAEAPLVGAGLHDDRMPMTEVAERVAHGEAVLLLVSLKLMHGDEDPHWILAHSSRDGVVLIEDPWLSRAHGETWLDGHSLPIGLDELDQMVAWGPTGYRGVVVLSRP
jgi:hypothetical protein